MRPIPRTNALFDLFVLGSLAGSLLADGLAPTGLTPNEFGFLSLIGAGGPLTPTDAAKRAGMPATTMSDYVRRYIDKGYITKAPNPADARSYLIELTAKGRAAWEAGAPGLAEALRKLEAELGDDLPEVKAALERLETAMRAAIEGQSY